MTHIKLVYNPRFFVIILPGHQVGSSLVQRGGTACDDARLWLVNWNVHHFRTRQRSDWTTRSTSSLNNPITSADDFWKWGGWCYCHLLLTEAKFDGEKRYFSFQRFRDVDQKLLSQNNNNFRWILYCRSCSLGLLSI